MYNVKFKKMTFYVEVNDEQLDFIKAFSKLSEEEKQKYLANLTEEERAAILGLQSVYEA